MTPGCWSGPRRAARPRPCTRSSISSARNAPRCSPTCPLTARTGSPGRPPPAPQAVLCAGPFHVVSWATGALDEVRREAWRTARQAGAITPVRHRSRTIRLSSGEARDLKHARYALWVKPREPHRPAGSQARLDRENSSLPLARLPAQRRAADSVQAQRRRRQGRPDPLAILGGPLPHPRIHRTRKEDSQASYEHPRDPGPRAEQRPDRIGQHQNPRPHQDFIRVPQRGRPHRPGKARPRRTQAPAPRKMITKLPTQPAGGPHLTVDLNTGWRYWLARTGSCRVAGRACGRFALNKIEVGSGCPVSLDLLGISSELPSGDRAPAPARRHACRLDHVPGSRRGAPGGG